MKYWVVPSPKVWYLFCGEFPEWSKEGTSPRFKCLFFIFQITMYSLMGKSTMTGPVIIYNIRKGKTTSNLQLLLSLNWYFSILRKSTFTQRINFSCQTVIVSMAHVFSLPRHLWKRPILPHCCGSVG